MQLKFQISQIIIVTSQIIISMTSQIIIIMISRLTIVPVLNYIYGQYIDNQNKV